MIVLEYGGFTSCETCVLTIKLDDIMIFWQDFVYELKLSYFLSFLNLSADYVTRNCCLP